MWGTVKTEQFVVGFQDDVEGWRELGNVSLVGGGKLAQLPLAHCQLGRGYGFVAAGDDASEHPGVSIAHHDRTGQISQALDRFCWLRTTLDGVTQADDLIYVAALDIGQHGFQRDTVSMD